MKSYSADELIVNGRPLRTTPVYDAYWEFAAERQRIFFRRSRGDAILTSDPILLRHRFTNAYRVSDRVSQFLISEVIANSEESSEDVLFRTLLFKIFNRIETWNYLESNAGPLHRRDVNWTLLDSLLSIARQSGPIYSAAYIMPSPPFGAQTKHTNHLRLIRSLLENGFADEWERTGSLRELVALLLDVPSFGRFLSFQFAIDLNYSTINPHLEDSYVVAGPGALNGIAKCFIGASDSEAESIIMAVTESQGAAFEERGIDFLSLFGRRLQPIDCQNLFCEIDKYARVAFPQYADRNGRTRIKQVYRRSAEPIASHRFPTSWQLRSFDWPNVSRAELL